jgi:hypothetical protein
MNFNFTEIREYLRIKGSKINIHILTASGKDGDSFVIISPTLLVSGYGSNEIEAKESFQHNMELFCKDFIELSTEQKESYLRKLGFVKEKYKTKNFSKLYVDENGALQGLEQRTLITSMLEATV